MPEPRAGRRNRSAVASLVVGVISLLTLGSLLPGIIGVVLGLIALKKTGRSPGQGRALAMGGIAMSAASVGISLVIGIFIFQFIVRPVKVEGTAMAPTLNHGDRLFVWQPFDEIERGDIVVFWFPDDPSKSFIKRAIGLPGERIRIDADGAVYINGGRLDEPYLNPERNRRARTLSEVMVKPHYYFVMGDNRDASNDSRAWGLVPEKYIYGVFGGRYYRGEDQTTGQ
jgi:signal peptidase I